MRNVGTHVAKNNLTPTRWCPLLDASRLSGRGDRVLRDWCAKRKLPAKKDSRGRWYIDMVRCINHPSIKVQDLGLLLLDARTKVEEVRTDGRFVRVYIRKR